MQDQLQELEELLYKEIPMTKYLSLKVASYHNKGLRLWAPLEGNVNHFGTAFAGSLSTLTTLSGWSMLWFILKELEIDGGIVIQDNHCKYLLPVTKDFAAFCYRPDRLQIGKFEQTLRKRGKARLELIAEICEEDEVAVAFKGRYVVQLN